MQPDDVAAAQALFGPPGGAGGRYIVGTPGVDRLYGGSGDDVLVGGASRDLLAGGEGDDFLIGGPEGSTLFGQGGADTFVFTGGRNWFMDFNAGEGDRIAGMTFDLYQSPHVQSVQAGEHLAIFLGASPWGPDADVIWLADTNAAPGGDWFAA